MFSPFVPQYLGSFRRIEQEKNNYFTSLFGIVNDNDDSNIYDMLLRSQRWWLHLVKDKTHTSLEFNLYESWRISSELLNFTNQLFVKYEDMKETQIVWDTVIKRYYLKKEGCRDVTDDNQLPIVRLFKEMPEKKPNGIWGVCKRPKDIDNPYDYWGVTMFKKLYNVVEEIPDCQVFV